MALSDIVIPTKTMTYRGTSFTVHGVTANDVMRMLFEAEHDVGRALDAIEKLKDADEAASRDLIAVLLRETPELVARVIASAADEPGSWSTVLKLPVSVQAEALAAVWDLTFEEPESVKKFVVSLTAIAQSMAALRTPKAA